MNKVFVIVMAFCFAATLAARPAFADSSGTEFCKKNYDSYKDRILKNANDADAWMEFRMCTTELKRWNDAAALAGTVLKSNPEQADAHLILGIAYIHTKEYQKAADELDDSLRIKHDQVMAYHFLGMVYLFMNQPKEAVMASERAVELEPNSPGHQSQLAYAYLLNDDQEKCEASAKKALQLDPNNVAAYKVLGNLYAKQGKQAQSDRAFEDAMHANGRLAAVQPLVDAKVGSRAAPAASTAAPGLPGGQVSQGEKIDDTNEKNEVDDPVAFCKSQWTKMTQFITRGDTETALLYFSDYADTRDIYRASFLKLGSRVRTIFNNFSELYDCNVVFAVATCKASIKTSNGALTETTIRFERNSDSVWRIRSF